MVNVKREFPRERFDQELRSISPRIGVYVKDLDTGTVYEYAADDRFPTASICKLPVMVELFRQAAEGKFSLDERRKVDRNDFSTWGTGSLRFLEDLPELTLRDYCRLMICISDNMATDFLMDLLGVDAVNATIEKLGFTNTRTSMPMGRWHYLVCDMGDVACNPENDKILLKKYRSAYRNWNGLASRDSLDNNVTSPRDTGTLLEKIHLGEIVSPEASAEMLGILKARAGGMIAGNVQWNVEVANKYGSGCGVKGDVGIVYLPTGPLLISAILFCTTGGGDWISKVARMAVEAFSPESLAR